MPSRRRASSTERGKTAKECDRTEVLLREPELLLRMTLAKRIFCLSATSCPVKEKSKLAMETEVEEGEKLSIALVIIGCHPLP